MAFPVQQWVRILGVPLRTSMNWAAKILRYLVEAPQEFPGSLPLYLPTGSSFLNPAPLVPLHLQNRTEWTCTCAQTMHSLAGAPYILPKYFYQAGSPNSARMKTDSYLGSWDAHLTLCGKKDRITINSDVCSNQRKTNQQPRGDCLSSKGPVFGLC